MSLRLTSRNYYGKHADMEYCSFSQYKTFIGTDTEEGCEARGLAEARHEIEHRTSISMMIGSFVDAYFSGEFEKFIDQHYDEVIARSGKNKDNLKIAYQKAVTMINRARRDPLFMEFMEGKKQKIYICEIGGVLFKCRMDVVHPERTVDLKTCRTLNVYNGKGILVRNLRGELVPFIYAHGYDIQAAIYQEARYQNEGGVRLPHYINAISKDTDPLDGSFHPMVKTIQIPQHVIDDRLKEVEQNAPRIQAIKRGEIEPINCGHCSYCNDTLPNDHVMTMDEFYTED